MKYSIFLTSLFCSKSLRVDASDSKSSDLESDACRDLYEYILQLSNGTMLCGKTLKLRLTDFPILFEMIRYSQAHLV